MDLWNDWRPLSFRMWPLRQIYYYYYYYLKKIIIIIIIIIITIIINIIIIITSGTGKTIFFVWLK